jgi:hypothetical protein
MRGVTGRVPTDPAPVAQGIEHRPPEAGAQVRILPGAPSCRPLTCINVQQVRTRATGMQQGSEPVPRSDDGQPRPPRKLQHARPSTGWRVTTRALTGSTTAPSRLRVPKSARSCRTPVDKPAGRSLGGRDGSAIKRTVRPGDGRSCRSGLGGRAGGCVISPVGVPELSGSITQADVRRINTPDLVERETHETGSMPSGSTGMASGIPMMCTARRRRYLSSRSASAGAPWSPSTPQLPRSGWSSARNRRTRSSATSTREMST